MILVSFQHRYICVTILVTNQYFVRFFVVYKENPDKSGRLCLSN